MRPMTMTTTIFRDLPNDLVEEILCLVQATYLKRLKYTCKRWNRLVNGDSRFAKKHKDKAAKQLLVLLVKKSRIFPTIFNLHGSVEFKSEFSLVDSHSTDSAQFNIGRAFHCDGLLLCTSNVTTRFVVWNPITGETRWFLHPCYSCFALGYYQEGNNKRYKILSFCRISEDYEIYEFSSDSWRTLDDITPQGWRIVDFDLSVSLKGNTYILATDEQSDISLLKFDFQTEKYVPVHLPYQCDSFECTGLSVVREEKLSVLLHPDDVTSKTEIWVTNNIDETTTQVVSWSKVLALDLIPGFKICDDINFLLEEEKKVAMICVTWLVMRDKDKNMLYIAGEDSEVTKVDLGNDDLCDPWILNYVPSLVQIK